MESMAGLKGKTVLVTGGTGFIGSNLVERLHILGANTVVSDIAINPQSLFIINGLHRKVKFEISDVRVRDDVYNLLETVAPDFIVHLAAQTLVTQAYENPIETFETNINGTINILEAARFLPQIKSIIIASSDKAYGKSDRIYNESFPLKGDHPYDVSKSSADLICQTYFKTYKSPVIITRFGNVYGEGDWHVDRIIPGIMKSLLRSKPLEIRSDGKYVRDYLYVQDVVDGYITLLQQNSKNVGEAFNFSSKDKLSVLEVVEKVSKVLGKPIEYVILNNAKNEIPYQHLNDSKIKKIGWDNKFNLEKVIPKVFSWYRKVF